MPLMVEKILLTRAEGLTSLCYKDKEFKTIREANSFLFRSHGLPKNGGYDKHDFTIIFNDGETYSGRLDCKHISCKDNDLDILQHVKEFCEFYSGRAKYPYMGIEKYREYLKHIDSETIGYYRIFLDKYYPAMETSGYELSSNQKQEIK